MKFKHWRMRAPGAHGTHSIDVASATRHHPARTRLALSPFSRATRRGQAMSGKLELRSHIFICQALNWIPGSWLKVWLCELCLYLGYSLRYYAGISIVAILRLLAQSVWVSASQQLCHQSEGYRSNSPMNFFLGRPPNRCVNDTRLAFREVTVGQAVTLVLHQLVFNFHSTNHVVICVWYLLPVSHWRIQWYLHSVCSTGQLFLILQK